MDYRITITISIITIRERDYQRDKRWIIEITCGDGWMEY